eukprot:3479615-Rhodomonas_salina.5
MLDTPVCLPAVKMLNFTAKLNTAASLRPGIAARHACTVPVCTRLAVPVCSRTWPLAPGCARLY